MAYQVNHYIAGRAISGKSTQALYNPATGEKIGSVALADHAIVNQAVDAAQEAFREWSVTPPLKRARILFQFKYLLEQHLEELAQLITQEHGKTLSDARGSVLRGIELVEFTCGISHLLKGSYSENVATQMDCYTLRQPLGVCAGVSPFNFPGMVPLWMLIPAIACGNTFILKPSEKDPSPAMRLAELLTEAGLPAGVLNIVNGDKTAVAALLEHPDIRAMTAVASTPVAEFIYQTAIAQGKRAHTFGGAKNHCVVMPDADITETATAILGAAYGSAGERCMAISAVIAVGDKVADSLVAELKKRIPSLKIGLGNHEEIEMGPLISKEHLERVKSYVDLGIKEGATLVVDGRDHQVKGYEKGYFMAPCLFDHVETHMRIYREEIFGPVLVIVRVKDFASALQLVNQHEYGNGTAIFTRDGEVAQAFASRVEVGMVGINVPIPVPVAYHSFGGWKRSFFGDFHMHADQSIQFYTKLKTVTTRWPKNKKTSAEFHMPTAG